MKKIIKIIIIISLILLLLFIYVFIEPYWLEIKVTEILDADIPYEFNDFKIIFITDIHLGKLYSNERLKELVNTINSLQPDLILLGGDYVSIDKENIPVCFDELSNLTAPYGVYGVLGNHDHWTSAELTRIEMSRAGIVCIDNYSEWINIADRRIKIGGVGDLWEDKTDIEETIKNVSEDDLVILVSHNPDFAENINSSNIDIMLSGHTHGGQVTIFGLFAPFLPSKYGQKYRTGVINTNNIKVIVSNGIGTISSPVRFFARPQLNVINLKSTN